MPRPSAAMLPPANDGTTGPPPTRTAWYFTICAALIPAAAATPDPPIRAQPVAAREGHLNPQFSLVGRADP